MDIIPQQLYTSTGYQAQPNQKVIPKKEKIVLSSMMNMPNFNYYNEEDRPRKTLNDQVLPSNYNYEHPESKICTQYGLDNRTDIRQLSQVQLPP